MWFKQTKLFELSDSFNFSSLDLIKKLEPLEFTPCLPSMPFGMGWVSPIDEDNAPLIQTINGYTMICLQVEEKILPAIVIRQELAKRIKQIESTENRKVRQKEKYDLKDAIVAMLLPRAFSRLTRVFAYIDTRNNWLILGTTHEKKTEQFISMLKKTIGQDINLPELKKVSYLITQQWLKHQNYPSTFAIEKTCMLQDPNQQNRIIRCQHQDLFSSSIQALIKEGCEVKQIGLFWQDRINFILADDLSLHSIKYQDEIREQANEMEPETKQQRFNADFLIMTETISNLLKDLLSIFGEKTESEKTKINNVVNIDKMPSRVKLA